MLDIREVVKPSKQEAIKEQIKERIENDSIVSKPKDVFTEKEKETKEQKSKIRPLMSYFAGNNLEQVKDAILLLDSAEIKQIYAKYGENLDNEYADDKILPDNCSRLYTIIYKLKRIIAKNMGNPIPALERFIENQLEKCTGRPLVELSKLDLLKLMSYVRSDAFKELLEKISSAPGSIQIQNQEVLDIIEKGMVVSREFTEEFISRIISAAANYQPDEKEVQKKKKKNEN